MPKWPIKWDLERQRNRYDGPVYQRYVFLYDLDTDNPKIEVEDRHRDINGIPMEVFNGEQIMLNAIGMTRNQIRDFINENKDTLNQFYKGFSVEWNGRNYVGQKTEEAQQALHDLEFRLEQYRAYRWSR